MSAPQPAVHPTAPPAAPLAAWSRLLCLGLAVLVILAYRAAGDRYYSGLAIPQGSGMTHLIPEELAVHALFTVFGAVAVLLLSWAIGGKGWDLAAVGLFSRPLVARGAAVLSASWCVLACSLLAYTWLDRQVTTDDEHVYRFIGETLRGGSLLAPSPGTDLEFYREQFVVLTPSARYGKYPIGHPLLLALGQAAGLESLVAPIVTGLTALALYLLGRQAVGAAPTALALLLFALSPQVLFVGATYLSQTTAALCTTLSLAALVRAESAGRRVFLVAAGAALGYGLLVRPLPGLLFVMVAAAYLAWRVVPRERSRRALLDWLAFALPVILGIAAFLLVNRLQTGGAFTTGYQAFHGVGEGATGLAETVTVADLANASMSLAASAIRLNAWVLGWPFGLALAFWARRSAANLLMAAIFGAEIVYRILSPKAGVGGTGALYFHEAVPALCLLAADGAVQLALRGQEATRRAWPAMTAVLLSGLVVCLTLFLPPRLADLRRMALAQQVAGRLVQARSTGPALVFHDTIVPWWTRRSWAYFPRCNSPSLTDPVLYVRMQRKNGLAGNLDFWRRLHPGRTAWYFAWPPDGPPVLIPLESLVESSLVPPPATR
jgi:hypothetical protein